jgi:hypothetical protein
MGATTSRSPDAKSFDAASIARGFKAAVPGAVPAGAAVLTLRDASGARVAWDMSKDGPDAVVARLPEDARRTVVVGASKTKAYSVHVPVARNPKGGWLWSVRKFGSGRGDLHLDTLLRQLDQLVPRAFQHHFGSAEDAKRAFREAATLDRLLVHRRGVYLTWAKRA